MGCPWSRAWRCFGRPAAGIASNCRRNRAPLRAGGDQDARGCPCSRAWQCLGRPVAGIASNCQRNLAHLPAGSDRDAEFARAAQPALAMIVIGRPRQRLTSFTDRGAWLHGVARGRVVGGALAGRLPGSRATAGGTWRRCRQQAIETPSLPDLTGRRLPAMIVIGRHRQRLSTLADRGDWLHGVGRGRVVGGALAGRLPGSRATASGTRRRCRQVVIETPEFARSDRPAAAGDDRHRAPPGTAVEFQRSRRLASWVARGPVLGSALAGRLPGSRATAGGTWRRCRRVAIETPSLPELPGRFWR